MNQPRATFSLPLFAAASVWLAACRGPAAVSTATPAANMPNPASAYCEAQGYQLEIRPAADGGQQGACIFPDGSECEEWAFFRGECRPGVPPAAAPSPTAAPFPAATARPTVEGGYAGWLEYTPADYSFAFQYPPDWVVEPDTNPVSMLAGHALFVRPADEPAGASLRVVFRRAGEDLLLWPTGVGEGEFIERDEVEFMGGGLTRIALVCDGRDQAIWYRSAAGGEIQRDSLEFSFILDRPGTCADGSSLTEAVQATTDMIVASFKR